MQINNVLLGVIFLSLIFLSWYLLFRRKKISTDVFPKNWKEYLENEVLFYRNLKTPDKNRFEQSILAFLDKVTITGVGTEVDDRDRLLVATSAVIPLFGFPGWSYRNLNEVLLYEGKFNRDYQTEGGDRNILGMVGSGEMNRMMILSKPELHRGYTNHTGKSNVGIHEFVHLLDKADGTTDGLPEVLMQHQFSIPWLKRIHKEIKEIHQGRSDINPYGATNEAEFLSVVSEYFFTQPQLLEKKHPELFNMLEKIYRTKH